MKTLVGFLGRIPLGHCRYVHQKACLRSMCVLPLSGKKNGKKWKVGSNL